MNYKKNYYDYISYVKTLNRKKLKKQNKDFVYYELHHIEPKSISPEISDLKKYPENGVLLTPREHFLAHYLLSKMYKGTKYYYAMLNAIMRMTYGQHNYLNIKSSRLYSYVRIERSKEFSEKLKGHFVSKETRDKISKSNSGKKFSIERRKEISERQKGKKRKPMSEEAKKKSSEKQKGKSKSELTKLNMSLARIGKKIGPLSDEHKQKIGLGNKGKKRPQELRDRIRNSLIGRKVQGPPKKWYNNGQIQTLSVSQPEGFVLGRIKNAK